MSEPKDELSRQQKRFFLARLLRDKARKVQTTYPLSSNQLGIWLAHQGAPDSPAYNVGFSARIRSRLDVETLRLSLQVLVDRHPALRTTIHEVDGLPQQTVHGAMDVALRVEKVPDIDLDELTRLLQTAHEQPFDLASGPLMRVVLFQRAIDDWVLLVDVHHLVVDGWSLWILIDEFWRTHRALQAGLKPNLPVPRSTYADFVEWQQQSLAGDDGDRGWRYWKEELSGELPVLDLPTDRTRPAVRRGRGETHAFWLSDDVGERIKKLSQAEGVTSFTTFLALFQVLLHRWSSQDQILVASPTAGTARGLAEFAGTVGAFVNPVVLRADLGDNPSFRTFLKKASETIRGAQAHQDFPFPTLVERLGVPRDSSRPLLAQAAMNYQKPQQFGDGIELLSAGDQLVRRELGGLQVEPLEMAQQEGQYDVTLEVREADRFFCSLRYDTDLFDADTAARMADHYTNLIESVLDNPDARVGELQMLSVEERDGLLHDHQGQARSVDSRCIHELFEDQARRRPQDIAVRFKGETLTFAALDDRADALASRLRSFGIGRGELVAVSLHRSPYLLVAMLGILKAGGAFVPVDPTYPSSRRSYMLTDARAKVVVTQESLRAGLPSTGAQVLTLDGPVTSTPFASADEPADPARADDLAYVIYTSGSTGEPNGVMVEHAQVTNFFLGMDERVGTPGPGKMLAVTTISFDISVLELLWTLTRGFEVVLQAEPSGFFGSTPAATRSRPVEFSLFFFAADSEGPAAGGRYRLLLDAARFADQHGFQAVWTPERHFHAFGGLYPNPSVVAAAVAAVTENVSVRAGSVVLPLHSPIRVAEEWAVVDNLSDGRVGISFASGWNADDFVIAPDRFEDRKDFLVKGIDVVQRLWRGEAVAFPDADNTPIDTRIHPRPLQAELPTWLTAAGNPETFELAGRLGTGLLTHMLGQGIETLTRNLAIYRKSWQQAGHEGEGHVTLMLHTFVGPDEATVRETVRNPFTSYLRTSADLMRNMAQAAVPGVNPQQLSEDELDEMVAGAFDRYFDTSGLFGTPESCMAIVNRLHDVGVDEVACLVDFGIDADIVLDGLKNIAELAERINAPSPAHEPDYSIAAQISNGAVTHLQCTPSLARMAMGDPRTRDAFRDLQVLMVGGEALAPGLATELCELVSGDVHDMYGPTETTIWSTTAKLDGDQVTVGQPIVNTQVHIVDRHGGLVPRGAVGELLIGGAGVVRGYLRRPKLTAERFIEDPFAQAPGSRLFRTGDLARRLADGSIEVLGRVDDQVKIRGFRIEPGEVETVVGAHPSIVDCVAVARTREPGDCRLAVYAVAAASSSAIPSLAPQPEVEELLAGHDRFTLSNGMVVAQHDAHQTAGIAEEVFGNEDYGRCGLVYREGACIFDVGANIGLFSLYANLQCTGATVHAFEPIPANRELAQLNAKLYGLDVTVHDFGLADRQGTAEFTFYPRMSGLSGRLRDVAIEKQEAKTMFLHYLENDPDKNTRITPTEQEIDQLLASRYECERIPSRLSTISHVIRDEGVTQIDLLKIDVEGDEANVLRGIDDDDWHRIHQVAIEVHGPDLLDEVVSLLDVRSFDVEVEDAILIEGRNGAPGVFVYLVYGFNQQHGGRPEGEVSPRLRAPTAKELRALCEAQLPPHAVPQEFVFLSELPRTPNGKVNRNALPAPTGRGPDRGAVVRPRNELEAALAGLWKELLGIHDVGVQDNFFELGGHSLLATQLLARIRDEVGVELSLQVLMQSDTLGAMALEIRRLSLGSDGDTILAHIEQLTDAEAAELLGEADQRVPGAGDFADG